jgi:hypothetical protein
MSERGSETSNLPVVWTNLIISCWDLHDILSQMVTVEETWLYYYDPETKQQSVEWRHGGSPRPIEIRSAKICWKISCLDFMGSRRHSCHWLFSKGSNYQHGVLIIPSGAIEGHFEEKTSREVHQGVLVLARQFSESLPTCRPEETGLTRFPNSWSPTILSGFSTVRVPNNPRTKKKHLKVCHFLSDAEVIAAA